MRIRQKHVTVTIACGATALAATISVVLSAHQAGTSAALLAQTATTTAPATTPARQLVNTYCVSCHNERVKTANLMLDKVDADRVSNSADEWEKVVVKLRSRAMPPPGARRPDNETYDKVAMWLETELDRAAAAHVNPGRPAALHRLNRAEYANAVRDLLGVEIEPRMMLPPDEQAHGFDTNADALSIQPALLDRYLSAAAKITRLAVGDPTIPPGFERYTALKDNSNESTWLSQNERIGEEFPLGSRGGIVARHYFPVDGDYVFKVRMDRTDTGLIRGLSARNDIEIRVDGARVGQLTIGGTPEFTGANTNSIENPDYAASRNPLMTADSGLEVRAPVKAGMRQVIATLVKTDNLETEGLALNGTPIWSREHTTKPNNPAMISSLLIGGPYGARVSQTSPGRERIYVCHPASSREETACATKILSTLARRAYRRTPTNDDIQTLVGFYQAARAGGDFDAGIRAGVERVLVSPDFLFRIEADPAGVAPGTAYNLSDVELASRVSLDVERQTRTYFAGAELLRRVAADTKYLADQAGSQPEVSLVRRQPASGVRQRDRAVSRRSTERRPQHRRLADLQPDVSQRAARAALRCLRRIRQPLPARHAHRRESFWPARQGCRSLGDVVFDSNGADDPREIPAREHPCRAAARTAGQCSGARREQQGR
ncbi:MAG: hypothetical protein AUI11_07360 [Acidobacteria bacterium 13_2_20CM_2_66_4]|nr:MAG: hypothetical protein AUI11_07360 [Acidobacteria bacterium 13_2_20CM_2_66_4]